MLNVWGRKSSSNVQAVMWCIAELQLPYKRHDAGFSYGVVDTPEYAVMNPNRLVPTVIDGDNPPLWESCAIMRYLANRYADAPFWPVDLLQRTEVDRWAEWAKINISLNFTGPVFWRVVRTAPAKRDPAAISLGLRKLNSFLAVAEGVLQQRAWLADEHFTLADVQFGHTLFRYFDIDIERMDFPAVAEYYQRLTERSAYREHVMVDYEELRVID